jgi:hypothetical protein
MTTTPEGRRELKALAEKATPGPWKADGTIYEHMVAEIRSIMPGEERGIAQVWHHQQGFTDARFIAAANPATVLSLLAALEEAEGREKARVDKVEKIGCRAAELTFDWLCGEFEDLPNKLAEDMSVKITDSIIWALGEGSVIDDFADAEQQVLELRARAEASEQREAGLREALKIAETWARHAIDHAIHHEPPASASLARDDQAAIRAALSEEA